MDDIISNGIQLGSNPASLLGNTSLETLQQQSQAEYTTLADLISTFSPASVGTSNLQDASVTNAKIANLTFETGQGNTLVLGGAENKAGVLKIKDASNNLIIQEDNTGFNLYNTSGTLLVALNSTGLHTYGGTVIQVNDPTGAQSGLIGGTSQVLVVGGTNGLTLVTSSGILTLENLTNSAEIQLNSNGNLYLAAPSGSIYFYGYSFHTNGNIAITDAGGGIASIVCGSGTKTAIVPTSQGYNALYCVESPEVWFFDFCDDKEHIDPMFLEVTEGEMEFIKTESGKYQVWRKRKGFLDIRFENKTAKQFIKNMEFWNIPQT